MPLVRETSGRFLRGPTGLLTHDLDCCCEQCTDFDTHACGAPAQLTSVISGCSLGNSSNWDADHCCMSFDDTYISSAFTFDSIAPCTWNLALEIDFFDPADCDAFPYDTRAFIRITCAVIYDQRSGDANFKYYTTPRVLIQGEFQEPATSAWRLETSPLAPEFTFDPAVENCLAVPVMQLNLQDYTGGNHWCIRTPPADPYPTVDFTLAF